MISALGERRYSIEGDSTQPLQRYEKRLRTAATTIYCRLKYCTAFSCFFAAVLVLNVPRFLRFPVFGFFLREYNRYFPDLSFLIMSFFSMARGTPTQIFRRASPYFKHFQVYFRWPIGHLAVNFHAQARMIETKNG
jgi:hypothetical protein